MNVFICITDSLCCTPVRVGIFPAISVSKDDSHHIAALQREPVRPKETREGEKYRLTSRHHTTTTPYSQL